ncbi:MAG: TIM barrel protein, partial [Planctomycetota bacterium]|nr:TIM barrel protein [Planctomycetota bacterium]
MATTTKATPAPPCPEKIRIGTIANGGAAPNFIRQTLPHGFESYSVMFWATLGGAKLPELAKQCHEALAGSKAVVSSLGMFGNPLTDDKDGKEVVDGFHACIDAAVLFGCDLVTGFAGRLPDVSIADCMGRFKTVWAPIAQHAADAG